MPPTADLIFRFAKTPDDIRAAQRLRYRVFVEELGSDGAMVDHDARLEVDQFDPHYLHYMAIDPARSDDPLDQCIAVYRLMPDDKRPLVGAFYSEGEYDLSALLNSDKKLLELGRSCIEPSYRGGGILFKMWAGMAKYVLDEGFDILFGTASFHGTDATEHAQALSLLHHDHLAPEHIRPQALGEEAHSMDLIEASELDKKAATRALPSLIKSYLRLGGTVGAGAWVDQAFNTIDVMLLVDTSDVTERQRAMFAGGIAE